MSLRRKELSGEQPDVGPDYQRRTGMSFRDCLYPDIVVTDPVSVVGPDSGGERGRGRVMRTIVTYPARKGPQHETPEQPAAGMATLQTLGSSPLVTVGPPPSIVGKSLQLAKSDLSPAAAAAADNGAKDATTAAAATEEMVDERSTRETFSSFSSEIQSPQSIRTSMETELVKEGGVNVLITHADQLAEDEDCVHTYGRTILAHFRKETLEKESSILPPHQLSGKMKLLLITVELVIIALFSIFMYWIVVVREANFDIADLFNTVTNYTAKDSGFVWNESNVKTLYVHGTVFALVFVVILPQNMIASVVFDFISPNRLMALTFAFKLTSFCLFFGGWFDITKVEFEDQDKDFKTHYYFSKLSVGVFIIYMVITGVKVTGHVFRRIFSIRVLGRIFKIVVSDWFVDAIDHLTTGAGFIALLTGVSAYLFISTKDEHFRTFRERSESKENEEAWLIRGICMLMSILYILSLLANFHKHYITNHTHCITVDKFRENFYQFKNLYDQDHENTLAMGEAMRKVTRAERMI